MQFDFSGVMGLMAVADIPIWDQYVDFLEWILNGLGDFTHSGGIAIILFTILVKTLMLPLTVKSIRSSKAMQDLAPKIKELQKKHGGDRQKASAEQMVLYQQYGVNPMAGCLPMIIQIPIFWGVYHAIRNLSGSHTGVWDSGFLWLQNLDVADPIHVLPIVAGIFQLIQSRMMRPANQKVTDPQQQMMNTMMMFMPLTVVIFGWAFAAGPVIYWVIQAMYSVVQQWFVTGWGAIGEWFPWLPELPEHRRLGYRPPRDINEVVVVSGEQPKRTGFQGWLQRKMEEAQHNAQSREQQARARHAGATPDGVTVDSDVVETTARQSGGTKRRDNYQQRVNAASRNRTNRNGDGANRTTTSSATRTGAKASARKKKRS